MKALPKKRKHQFTRNLSFNLSEASMLKYQAAWYSASIAVYIWFLFWVSYDFFVLQKPIAEMNVVNYVGAIAAMAFIWVGTKIWKRNRVEVQKTPQKTAPLAAPVAAPSDSTPTHHLGYLNQRQKHQEIPSECLTCEHVIKCMSSAN